MNARHVLLSDCWSSEDQPATYYREAAARARSLQGDATTPRVKQYLDKMIAHCERLVGKVEPGEPSAADRRYAGRSRMSGNHIAFNRDLSNSPRRGVKRHAIGTPDRHAKGTPDGHRDRLVPVANRRAPRGSRSALTSDGAARAWEGPVCPPGQAGVALRRGS